jgi:hypothetical protein
LCAGVGEHEDADLLSGTPGLTNVFRSADFLKTGGIGDDLAAISH